MNKNIIRIEKFEDFIKRAKSFPTEKEIGTPISSMYSIYEAINDFNSDEIFIRRSFKDKTEKYFGYWINHNMNKANIISCIMDYSKFNVAQKKLIKEFIKDCIYAEIYRYNHQKKNQEINRPTIAKFLNAKTKLTFNLKKYTTFDDIYKAYKEYTEQNNLATIVPYTAKFYLYTICAIPMYIHKDKYYFGIILKD